MFPADLPPRLQETVTCSIAAAARYDIPANMLLAIAEIEGGRPGLWVQNKNGTSDVGAMQFNTAYLATLAKYGITAQAVAEAGCYAYDLAAWRLRQHLHQDRGDVWTRAANYHSRTPYYNARYRSNLVARSAQWAAWLEQCATRACTWHATRTTVPQQHTSPTSRYVPRAIAPTTR